VRVDGTGGCYGRRPCPRPTNRRPDYDRTYERVADELYATIRREAFGEEIGQFSWLTADEYRHFFTLLGIDAGSEVLEVASGSGGLAVFMAQETGCRVTGLDIHQAGVHAA